VTGVQTCALPISGARRSSVPAPWPAASASSSSSTACSSASPSAPTTPRRRRWPAPGAPCPRSPGERHPHVVSLDEHDPVPELDLEILRLPPDHPVRRRVEGDGPVVLGRCRPGQRVLLARRERVLQRRDLLIRDALGAGGLP